MNHPNDLVQIPTTAPIQRVEVEGRVYEIVQVHPHAISHQHPQTPQYIQPAPGKRSTMLDDPIALIGLGLGCCVVGGVLAWVIVKAFAPAPIPTPAQPQTVIVQPPVPEKRPYSREECRASGMFGWGQDCYRERGYQ